MGPSRLQSAQCRRWGMVWDSVANSRRTRTHFWRERLQSNLSLFPLSFLSLSFLSLSQALSLTHPYQCARTRLANAYLTLDVWGDGPWHWKAADFAEQQPHRQLTSNYRLHLRTRVCTACATTAARYTTRMWMRCGWGTGSDRQALCAALCMCRGIYCSNNFLKGTLPSLSLMNLQ